MNKIIIGFVSALTLLSPLAISSESASAHVSIVPGVSATGSSTASLTAGQSGYLTFRIGHGCTDQTSTPDPITGLSMSGRSWGTHSFSVEVPVIAQGTGSTIPKAQYIPGWHSSVVKNVSNNTYLVTWTAVSSDFDVPDAPVGGAGGKQFADFGISIKWAAAALGDVYFKAAQVCNVDMSTIPATSEGKSIKFRASRSGSFATIDAGKSLAGQTVTFYSENGFTHTAQVNSKGKATIWLSSSKYSEIKVSKKLLAVKKADGVVLGFVGGQKLSRQIFVDWDVTDGSGADPIMDAVEHNTAPKVTVLAAS